MNTDCAINYNFDTLDGDALMELEDFSKLLWCRVSEDAEEAFPTIYESDTISPEAKAESKYIFFIHYFNLLMVTVLGHGLGGYKSHVRKHITDKRIKKFLTKKINIHNLLEKNTHNINLLNAIIRTYISKLMEGGVSTQRLDSALDMHYLNAISMTVPNIRKNSAMRSHIMPMTIEDFSLFGRIKRFFNKQVK